MYENSKKINFPELKVTSNELFLSETPKRSIYNNIKRKEQKILTFGRQRVFGSLHCCQFILNELQLQFILHL